MAGAIATGASKVFLQKMNYFQMLVCIGSPRERGYNIQHWTDVPKGGHFAAMEQPTLLANDIIQFAKKLGTL